MKILAIESSCDETACAIVEDGLNVLSNVVATQIDMHRLYGGVVPEIASRMHSESIYVVAKKALEDADCTLEDVDAVAVTYAPGLIGALLVGISFAKGLAMAAGKPLIPVHHIAGHIAANYISHPGLKPPYLCLVISGGNTNIVHVEDYTKFTVLGRTRDDAAGEALDKAARMIGFEYPGGKYIDEAAKKGDPTAYSFPHPKVAGSEFDFSFSGLKTAVVNLVHNAQQRGEEDKLSQCDIAASYQKTVCDILVQNTMLAADRYGFKKLSVVGGVSANSGVRAAMEKACGERGIKLYLPELKYCGDNAAMIGCQAYYDYLAGRRADESLNGIATLPLDSIYGA